MQTSPEYVLTLDVYLNFSSLRMSRIIIINQINSSVVNFIQESLISLILEARNFKKPQVTKVSFGKTIGHAAEVVGILQVVKEPTTKVIFPSSSKGPLKADIDPVAFKTWPDFSVLKRFKKVNSTTIWREKLAKLQKSEREISNIWNKTTSSA